VHSFLWPLQRQVQGALLDNDFVRLLFNHKQNVTLGDVCAFTKVSLFKEAFYAGAKLNSLNGFGASRILNNGCHFLLGHFNDNDAGQVLRVLCCDAGDRQGCDHNGKC